MHRLESNGDELTPENVKNLKLEWSLKLDSPPKKLTGLTAPLARATMATPHGVKPGVWQSKAARSAVTRGCVPTR
jgi:hypothetical protein